MEFIRIRSIEDTNFKAAWEIYNYSFPRCEKRNIEEQEKVLKDERFYFYILKDEKLLVGEIAGIFAYWQFNSEEVFGGTYYYGEHLAINKDIRNSGLGAKVVELLKSYNKPIIIEIEIPIDEITKRREGFYNRLDFILNEHYHIQPPYNRDEQDLELKIMTWPKAISKVEYNAFKDAQKKIMPQFK